MEGAVIRTVRARSKERYNCSILLGAANFPFASIWFSSLFEIE
jgi:hypothetical protein